MKGVYLAELTYVEAAEAVKSHPIVMLPIGAGTKEHGPHLPCGTDLMVVEELAQRVTEKVEVVRMPALAYGYFPAFTEWPGSVSVSAVHFVGMVGDIVRGLCRHGWCKFLILDGGVSTHPPLRTLSSDLHHELGVQVAVTDILGLGHEVEQSLSEQLSGGHADEIETSCMLAIRPDLVKMERAVREYDSRLRINQGGVRKITLSGKMSTKSGINGDATLATAKKGEKVLTAMAQDIIDFVEEFMEK